MIETPMASQSIYMLLEAESLDCEQATRVTEDTYS